MPSTYSSLKFELIGTGEQTGTWGSTTNTNIGTAINEAITGSADVVFSSGDVTLSFTDTNETQAARNLRLNLIGSVSTTQSLIVPSIEKLYLVNNTLSFDITVKNISGDTGIAVPAGRAMFVYNNGTNVNQADTSVPGGSTLAVSLGGTGATDAAGARTNLSAAVSGANNDITSITGMTTPLSLPQGGTGASTAGTARTNLGLAIGTDIPSPTGTGASGNWNINSVGVYNATGWSITPSGTTLFISYNGTNVAKLDSSGNLTVKANVTAYGTV